MKPTQHEIHNEYKMPYAVGSSATATAIGCARASLTQEINAAPISAILPFVGSNYGNLNLRRQRQLPMNVVFFSRWRQR